jgi:predicted enzyme related to lactoylglutathione lyase
MLVRAIFVLEVSNMARARAFYRRALGLSERFDSEEWTELDARGATVALRHDRTAKSTRDTGLSFEVSSIEKACVDVREAGGKVVSNPVQMEDVDLKLARAEDPEGNVFSLVETG